MKKTAVIIGLIALAVIIAFCAVFAFMHFYGGTDSKTVNDKPDEITVSERLALLRCNDVKDLTEKAKKSNVSLSEYDDGLYKVIENVDFGSMSGNAFFEIENNKMNDTSGAFVSKNKYTFTDTESDYQNILYDIQSFTELCSILFNTDVSRSYNIYATDGSILEQDVETYQKLIDNKAKLALYVLDADGTFWRFESQTIEGVFEIDFYRWFNADLFKNMQPDINLKDGTD